MNSKRKNRGPVRTQRNRSITAEGVYSNPHFMHTATAQVGNIVRLKTAKGFVFEGVFKTFSSNFEVVLEVAACVSNPDNPNLSIVPSNVVDKLIFKPRDIVTIVAKDVDLEYPTRDTFQTDTAISARLNGTGREQKELEPWEGELNGGGAPDAALELDNAANGWDANDMFKKNEQEYGVTSTFDHSLRGYTVQLQTSDTADYKEAEAKANQIANEIENQPNHKARLDLENGDEEAVFAAVVRPNDSNGKYIPPAKRKHQNTVKVSRSTPTPPTTQQGVVSPSGSSNGSPNGTIPHQPSVSPKGSSPTSSVASTPAAYPANTVVASNVVHVSQPPMHPPPAQNPMPVVVPTQLQGHVQNQVPVTQTQGHQGHHQRHSHTPPHAYGGQQRQGGQQKGQHMNGEAKQMSRVTRNMYQPAPPSTVPPQMQQPSHQGMVYQNSDVQPKVPEHNNHNRHHREEVKDLQQFSQEFQLAATQMNPKDVVPLQQLPSQNHPPPQVMEHQVVPQHIMAQQQQPLRKPSPQSTPPQPSVSPQQDGVDKVTNTLKKSTLNPNAKEFVLNPTAKPFQPRSPSTPSLSRPHTPQTPSHSPYVPTAMNGPMGQPPASVLMPMGYMMASQPQYPQQPQGSKIRRIPMGQMRTDVASQMQVAAATGQPLLAPAPMQPFVYPGSINAPAYHQVHAVRMYDAPPQLQYITHNPSQTGSPAQPPPYPQGQPPQAPHQQYQTAPPPQGGVQTHQYLPMCNLIPAQPHMMQSMQYIQQAPPPQHPIPLILHNQQHQVHQGPA
ncbi:hypothetical protein WA026_002607 [Henosepilachna vigintioctopunctata]|uniref:LsmAD domain-containing protein n=1 Tax=Henosepilachna vigintioctopunctata TaxID=420089 RepID=A0AAW1U172_9CUCU